MNLVIFRSVADCPSYHDSIPTDCFMVAQHDGALN
jgi:hypothetical protein